MKKLSFLLFIAVLFLSACNSPSRRNAEKRNAEVTPVLIKENSSSDDIYISNERFSEFPSNHLGELEKGVKRLLKTADYISTDTVFDGVESNSFRAKYAYKESEFFVEKVSGSLVVSIELDDYFLALSFDDDCMTFRRASKDTKGNEGFPILRMKSNYVVEGYSFPKISNMLYYVVGDGQILSEDEVIEYSRTEYDRWMRLFPEAPSVEIEFVD